MSTLRYWEQGHTEPDQPALMASFKPWNVVKPPGAKRAVL
jgi:hypothetical protein